MEKSREEVNEFSDEGIFKVSEDSQEKLRLRREAEEKLMDEPEVIVRKFRELGAFVQKFYLLKEIEEKLDNINATLFFNLNEDDGRKILCLVARSYIEELKFIKKARTQLKEQAIRFLGYVFGVQDSELGRTRWGVEEMMAKSKLRIERGERYHQFLKFLGFEKIPITDQSDENVKELWAYYED